MAYLILKVEKIGNDKKIIEKLGNDEGVIGK
jgi:hypothetical protein